jgi:diguanylate cyclase (GGDEF)-like protein/PAS domain S-box-containing protein
VVASSETIASSSEDRTARTATYRAVVAEIPELLLVMDAQGLILDVSYDVHSRFGYGIDEMVGRSAFDFIHPADHHHVAVEMIRKTSDPSGRGSIRCRCLRPDGSWAEFEVQGFNHFDDPEVGGLLVILREISSRPLGDRVMAAGDYLYSAMTTVASDATTIFDAAGRRMYASPSLGAMLGFTPEEVLAAAPQTFVHPDDLSIWTRAKNQALATENGTARTELRLLRADASELWIEATVVNLLHDAGVAGVVVHARDIDQRRRVERVLRDQATTDALTGLANRFALMEELSAACAPQRTSCTGFALLFCDLDDFKLINDTQGHKAGDQVLRAVAAAIESAIRPSDFVARIGGDEFCILGYELESVADAHRLAERIRAHVITVGDDDHRVGVSIGVAWTDASALDPDQLLSSADRAMYKAKRQGSNRIETVELGSAATVDETSVAQAEVCP